MDRISIDFILITLKYLAILMGGFFGVYGLLLDFKDKNGKITKAGKWALSIIILSGIVTIVTQSIELHLDKVKSNSDNKRILEELEQNKKVLNELDRSLNPIEDLNISFELILPCQDAHLSNYTNDLFERLTSFLDTIKFNHDKQKRILKDFGLFPIISTLEDKIVEVELFKQSMFFPNREQSELALTILSYTDIDLVFSRDPVPIDLIQSKQYSKFSGGDLCLNIITGLNDKGLSGEHQIIVNLDARGIKLLGSDLKSDPKYWKSNGKVVSIPDILGCQLIVHLSNSVVSGNKEVNSYLYEVRKQLEIGYLIFKMSKGREYWIRREKLQKIVGIDGLPLYVFQFPSKIEELENMK